MPFACGFGKNSSLEEVEEVCYFNGILFIRRLPGPSWAGEGFVFLLFLLNFHPLSWKPFKLRKRGSITRTINIFQSILFHFPALVRPFPQMKQAALRHFAQLHFRWRMHWGNRSRLLLPPWSTDGAYQSCTWIYYGWKVIFRDKFRLKRSSHFESIWDSYGT